MTRLAAKPRRDCPRTVLTIFGTRPEVIKLGPVIQALERRPETFVTVNVASGQHEDLARPFVELFDIRVDYDLSVMEPSQTPSGVAARVLSALDPILATRRPDLVLVQGDTTTAMAGALAAFHRGIPVGHVEAGLRSGDSRSPFPEEMNRRLITRLASCHFAATARNRESLLGEGIPPSDIFVTGNPVVDALGTILARGRVGPTVRELASATADLRRLVLTTHRRESFGTTLTDNLRVLRRFVERHPDVALIFPVHPNPVVVEAARAVLSGHRRIHLCPPLGYEDFISLLSLAWLIVSDSGGVQEEAPTLGKPLLVLRENTERSEALDAGVARLVGGRPDRLASMLEEVYADGSWGVEVQRAENPFGRGDSAQRIAEALTLALGVADVAPAVSEALR